MCSQFGVSWGLLGTCEICFTDEEVDSDRDLLWGGTTFVNILSKD